MQWYSNFVDKIILKSTLEGSDPYQLQKDRQVVSFTIVIVIVHLYFMGVYKLYFGVPYLGEFALTSGLVSLLSLYSYRITGDYRYGAWIIMVTGSIDLFFLSIFSGGGASPLILWYMIIPFSAGILLDSKAAYLNSLICISLCLMIYLVESQGMLPADVFTREQSILIGKVSLISMLVTGVILTSFNRVQVESVMSLLKKQKLAEQELIRVLVHDVSNPLMIIQTHTKKLLSVVEKEEYCSSIARIEKGSNVITEIVTHIRDMKAMEDGKKKIVLTEVVPMEIVENTADSYIEKLHIKELDLCISNHTSNEKVMANPGSFSNQVIGNLLSNAIKFSHLKGKIWIDISCEEGGVCISVRDEGVGMPKELLENLFDLDKPTSRTGTNGESGTGFGMPLVKKYVESFGGELEVHSFEEVQEGDRHGTEFIVHLKLAS
ncbi:hypothetical protein A9Q84_00480 [Halobacteriovorax marinus]|uniref:histidine kinase n=1 Tax=Halobacteriovorax marinus TaxID=97084 RepID=A0A1Y5FBN2_9BACT|nr:hypothetical protein A9Q84_00480 [Halobacteriovorax marinus]